jgi:hypothetical protein
VKGSKIMDFGAVLSRTWQIIRKHKVLWIFGILAGCTGVGSSGGGNTGIRFSGQDMPRNLQPFIEPFQRIPNWQIATLALIVIIVVITLVLLAIVLGTVGRIGLIRGTLLAEQGSERILFGELFSDSLGYFWRVLVINLVGGILLFIAFMIIGLPLILVTCGAALLCILPLLWFAQLVIEQTNIAIVVENTGISDGLRRGWEVVTKNLGPMIVMALILFLGVGLIGGIIIGLPLALVAFPAIAQVFLGGLDPLSFPRFAGPGIWISLLCLVAYLPVLIVLSGILQAYISSAWTLTYMRLTRLVPPIETQTPMDTIPPAV